MNDNTVTILRAKGANIVRSDGTVIATVTESGDGAADTPEMIAMRLVMIWNRTLSFSLSSLKHGAIGESTRLCIELMKIVLYLVDKAKLPEELEAKVAELTSAFARCAESAPPAEAYDAEVSVVIPRRLLADMMLLQAEFIGRWTLSEDERTHIQSISEQVKRLSSGDPEGARQEQRLRNAISDIGEPSA